MKHSELLTALNFQIGSLKIDKYMYAHILKCFVQFNLVLNASSSFCEQGKTIQLMEPIVIFELLSHYVHSVAESICIKEECNALYICMVSLSFYYQICTLNMVTWFTVDYAFLQKEDLFVICGETNTW